MFLPPINAFDGKLGTQIRNTDAITFLNECQHYNTIIADPPDNIGLHYEDAPHDHVRPDLYYDWLELVILKAFLKCDMLWLSIYHKHLIEMCYRIRSGITVRHPSWSIRMIVWRFTFGQYNDREMGNGFRPMFLFVKPGANPNWDAIREPSERMNLGDKRAAGPRIPDDVWEIPRVTGNSHDRQQWHPTQHPTELYKRILQVAAPTKVSSAVDIFGGSGTIFRAAQQLGKLDWVHYVDISPTYCQNVFLQLEQLKKLPVPMQLS